MNKSKLVLTILAVVMMCSLAVAGTLAFLTETTGSGVVNTFVSAGGLIEEPTEPGPESPYDNNGFFVLENAVTQLDDGSYEFSEDETISLANAYEVLPSVDLPKNPFVRINGKTDVAAYLYIEVVDTLGDNSGLSYTIISDNWKATSLTGSNGGDIYVYVISGEEVLVTSDVDDVAILENDTVTVGDTLDIPDGAELSFYGYLAQASAGEDATEVFTNCFLGD